MTATNQITVCIVEDNRDIRESLVSLLEQSAECTCSGSFETGEEALEAIPYLHPDIVLMDIDLPGMNGIACIKKLKQLCPGIQFLICSVYDEGEQVVEALAAGANGYILKRSAGNITQAIQELHNGGSPMSSDIARKIVSYVQKKAGGSNPSLDITSRETEILKLLARGFTYQQAAEQLFISPKTIKKHIYNIYGKLHVSSRTEAVNKFFGLGS